MGKSKVYFTKEITANSLVRIYNAVGKKLDGNVAIKISTGEPGGHNFLNPNLIKDLVNVLNGTIVECNTIYDGRRRNTEEHLKVAKEHGFCDIANVDIMDADGDIELSTVNGKHLKTNYVGAGIQKYNSILMLSHFKGHVMGGFGGALKNMSIGMASSRGKAWIHSAGTSFIKAFTATQGEFIESMAEADKSVVEYIKDNIVYINVINNISIDCDCNSNPKPPCMADIGIVASTDPVAIDKACLDMIYNSHDKGKYELIERIESLNGQHIIDYAYELGIGQKEYELLEIY